MARTRVLHELHLDKIAAVDFPCQQGALAVIMKRDSNDAEAEALLKVLGGSLKSYIDDFIASNAPQFQGKSKKKRIQMALAAYYGKRDFSEDEISKALTLMPLVDRISKNMLTLFLPERKDSSKQFSDTLEEALEQDAKWKRDSALSPLFQALRESVLSILNDPNLDEGGRQIAVRNSVSQFLSALEADPALAIGTAIADTFMGKRMHSLRLRLLKSRLELLRKSGDKLSGSSSRRGKKKKTPLGRKSITSFKPSGGAQGGAPA